MEDIAFELFIIFAIIFVPLSFLPAYYQNKKKEAKKRDLDKKIQQNINNSGVVLDRSYRYATTKMFGINKQEKILILYDYTKDPKYVKYPFKKIVDAKINVDGVTVTSSSTGGTIGRALVGGVLAGGVGAIIGGTTGKKTGKKQIQKMELQILLNDIDLPSVNITFFDNVVPVNIEVSDELRQAEKDIIEWLNIFKVIAYQNEHPDNSQTLTNGI